MRAKRKRESPAREFTEPGCAAKDKIFKRGRAVNFAGKNDMEKSRLKILLEKGGSFTADAALISFHELVLCAKAARKGGGTLTVINADSLWAGELTALCEHGADHIAFPDLQFNS